MKSLLRPPSGYRLGWACGAVLAVSLCAPQVVRGEEVTKSFGVTGRPNVRVETNDGSVRVTSGDAKQVEFRVEYQGYELAKNLRVDARQDGNKVELIARATGHWGMNFGWGHNRRLHIEVHATTGRFAGGNGRWLGRNQRTQRDAERAYGRRGGEG